MANNVMGVASIGQNITDFDTAPQEQAYTKVIVVVPNVPQYKKLTQQPPNWTTSWKSYYRRVNGEWEVITDDTPPVWGSASFYTRTEDSYYEAGSDSSRVLTVENPLGSTAMAQKILSDLSGWRYQPFTADGSLLTPLAELGDGLNMYGTDALYSGIYKQDTDYTALCTADVSAPTSEELDHEYNFESSKDREINRKFQVLSENVSSSVSQLEQKADSISATVSTKLDADGISETFSWKLKSNGFYINNDNIADSSHYVFKVNANGAVIKGKITALSGAIGNWTLDAKDGLLSSTLIPGSLHTSGKTFGTDGIWLIGSGETPSVSIAGSSAKTNWRIAVANNFGVTNGGALFASEARISGRIIAESGSFGSLTINSQQETVGTYSGNFDNCGGSISRGVTYGGGGYGSIGDLDVGLSNVVAEVGTLKAQVVTTDNLYAKIADLNSVSVKALVYGGNTIYRSYITYVSGIDSNGRASYATSRVLMY